jgi:general stress protein 26
LESDNIDDEALESFIHAKVVYMITYGHNGEMHSRPMTNFNENMERKIWFPSYKDTQKINDIKHNPKTKLLFPSINKDIFYELEGTASFANRDEVEEKWVWWYLYWHPEMKDYFLFDQTKPHPERVIINIKPEKIKKISRKEIKKVWETYESLMPKE